MGVAFLDRDNLPVMSGMRPVALDTDAIDASWRPGAFFANWLQKPGLAGATTIVEVLEEEVWAILARTCDDPDYREDRLAHHDAVAGELRHVIVPTPHLIAVQARFLAIDAVTRLVNEQDHWRTRALLVAAAIEYRLPLFGRSKFYQRLAEVHPIPAGVLDPHSGRWLVRPS